MSESRTNWSPKAWKVECRTKVPWGRSCTSLWGGSELGWVTVEQVRLMHCGRIRSSFRSQQPVSGRATHMTLQLRRKRQITARNTLSKKPSTRAGRIFAIAFGLMAGVCSPAAAGDSVVTLVSYSTGQNGSQLKWKPSSAAESEDVQQAAAIGQIGDLPSKPSGDTVPLQADSAFSDPFQDTSRAALLQTPKINNSPAEKSFLAPGPAFTAPTRIEGSSKLSVEPSKPPMPPPPPLRVVQVGEGEECPKLGVELKSLTKTRVLERLELPEKELPPTCPLPRNPQASRGQEPITFAWTASALCSKPAYFDDVQVERYGHSWGLILQPVLSGAHFVATIPSLPYLMGLNPPCECVYTLGYYRPGSCVPTCWTLCL